jgi:hypothetical protein
MVVRLLARWAVAARLGRHPELGLALAWSPDGKRIAYSFGEEGVYLLRVSASAVGRRSCPVALGAHKNVLSTRVRIVLQIVQTSQRVTTLRTTITKLGGPITIRRRCQPCRGTLSAHHRHRVTRSRPDRSRARALRW